MSAKYPLRDKYTTDRLEYLSTLGEENIFKWLHSIKQRTMTTKISIVLACAILSANANSQDGSIDNTFNPGAGTNGAVLCSVIQPDGKIVIGGDFTSVQGVSRNGVARLNPNGSLDATFNPGSGLEDDVFAPTALSVALQTDGKILFGGTFSTYDGIARGSIVRCNGDGSIDGSFDPGLGATYSLAGSNAQVHSIAVQSNGGILVGGIYSEFDGEIRRCLSRLNSDGELDLSFDPFAGQPIISRLAITLQNDGKIVVAGGALLRLNFDGSIDGGFISVLDDQNSEVNTVALQPDGQLVVGGQFSTINGVARPCIARINTDGSLDGSFDPALGFTGSGLIGVPAVLNVNIQPDGRIIAVGDFTHYNGIQRNAIVRLETDGSNDGSFNPGDGTGPASAIWTSSLLTNGKIFIGGYFSTYDGVARNNVARVNGEAACSDYILELQSDATAPGAVTYEVLDETGSVTILSGDNPVPANEVGEVSLCLPDGCYQLRVTDSAGDGLLGYVLRESGEDGRRIIDNSGNMITGVSALANGETFCVPIGDDLPIWSSCDKLDWIEDQFIVCHANTAVSAEYGFTNTTSGYEFWFYDPNGSYSFRRFRSHSTSDGYGSGATRACHFKINGWVDGPSTPHIPSFTFLNVRVRGRVAGENLPFGPACQFAIDPVLAMCPRVKLQDDPAFIEIFQYSCGVERNFGGPSNNGNRIYANPPQPTPSVPSNQVRYQFRFRETVSGTCIVRPPQSSARMVLNWTSGTLLQCGSTYDVDVRVSLDAGSTWCFGPASSSQAAACADTEDWGKVCQVTINPCAQPGGESNSLAIEPNGGFTVFPNPNMGDHFNLDLSKLDMGPGQVEVSVLNMMGQKLAHQTVTVSDGMTTCRIDLVEGIATGSYLVTIRTNDAMYSQRMVVASH